MKRKLEEIQVPRKKLKKEVTRLLKENVDLKKKKIRRALETNFSLPKKTLDPAKEALNELILKIRTKLKSKADKKNEKEKIKKVANEVPEKKESEKIENTTTETVEIEISTPQIEEKLTPQNVKSDKKSFTSSFDIKWRKENNVTVEDETDLSPFTKFSDLNLEHKFRSGYEGFETPMPIQAQSWPYAFQGRDIIGIAETGSGKTLGFVLPALVKLFKNPENKSKNARVMILAPTRELAGQIEKTIGAAGKGVECKSVCIYGGVPKWEQLKAVSSGVDFIVATPGRLLAFAREGKVCLWDVEYVVLDEADRLLDQGFIPDVTELVEQCRPKGTRQTMLFSATWPIEVQKLGRNFLENPCKITVSRAEGKNELSTVATVSQECRVMGVWDREDALYELLDKNRDKKIIVFGLYKKECERLEYSVADWGFPCCSLHGNKSQDQRTKVFKQFRDNKCRLLIATDVASRGLDVPDVELVINFTFPLTVEDYCHRIGRTGRAGKKGESITFFTDKDKLCARDYIQLLEKSKEHVPPELMKLRMAKRFKRNRRY